MQGFTPDQPITRWSSNNRDMILVESFMYTAKDGSHITAEVGQRINGKSTPRPLRWSFLVGSPYTGSPRRPSVIHDVMCAHAKRLMSNKEALYYRRYADKMYAEMIDYSEWQARKLKDEQDSRWAKFVGCATEFVQYAGVRVGAWWAKFKRRAGLV